MIKKLMQLVLMIMLVMGMSVASQAATITVGEATGVPGDTVAIPITIDDTAGRTDCSFAVSFDNTKLEYVSKTAGNMNASLLMAKVADINAAGKAQPIVTFDVATSGTIVTFNFKILAGASGVIPLPITDITPTGVYTGKDGKVTIPCTGPTITVGSGTACKQGDTVAIAITIDDTAGRTDCSFAVSFDNTKLEYVSKTAGDMNASLLMAKVADINAAGKAQPIVTFDVATSGTIVTFNFSLLADLAKGQKLDLTISDITPSGTYCGESGEVECPEIPACTVTIDPQTATVLEGGTRTFTATTTGTDCKTPVYVWTINTSIGSTITAEGVYTAGLIQTGTSATDIVTATDSANGNAKGDAVITVLTLGRCVAISPASATVECGNTVQFSATKTGTDCATPEYTWEVVTTIGSTVTQNGFYTAGENNQDPCRSVTDIVRVTDTANNDSASATITVNPCCPPPCIAALTADPTESAQGQTLKVKLKATDKIFKNVNKDDILVDFGQGITVNKITDKSDGSITVEITIDAHAVVGTRTVLVTTPTECAEGPFGVTQAPTINVTPSFGRAGETIETVTITGRDTHFAKNKSKVKFGKNIDKSNKVVVDENTITLKIKIGKKAVTGSRTVTVTTDLGNNLKEVANGTFTVLPPATQ